MPFRPTSFRWCRWPAPGQADVPRAVGEGLVGYLLLIGLAVALAVTLKIDSPVSIPGLLAWIWLACWPAFRLRAPAGRHAWTRALKHAARVVVSLALLGTGSIVALNLLLRAAVLQRWAIIAPRMVPILVVGFVATRAVVMIAMALQRRAQRRLRWRLTASHLAVIAITFVAMTALGSVVAINLLALSTQPSPGVMAASAADTLRASHPAGARLNALLQQIADGHIALRGEAPLFTVLLHRPSEPMRILIMRPDGTILAAATDARATNELRLVPVAAALPALLWRPLRDAAVAGRSGVVRGHVTLMPNRQESVRLETVLGAAPLDVAHGRVTTIAVIQVVDVSLTPVQFLTAALAIFSLSTLAVMLASALPVLGLSSLFGYLLARSMTRRLEAVSRVTTAIAEGDLARRAPEDSEDEVGRLAGDVNRMATHLETTIGELERARAQAEDALRSRQDLVASISHELRTPLAIVRAHLETLTTRHAVAAGPPPTHGSGVTVSATTLHALQEETERLEGLIDDLFTLSRAQTGALQLRVTALDVAALLEEVAALMRPLAQSEALITLSVDAPAGLPPALADGDRLRQIVLNLVRNAVRHTPDGGIIALAVRAEPRWVVVSVADTGEGIPAEHLPHIFERFYRVDPARARGSGGAGLGLAIVREFVELMGGHITVESAPGNGSCFDVFLPRATE